MAQRYGPRIVTRGLIFNADPNDIKNQIVEGTHGMANLVGGTRNTRYGAPTVGTLGGVTCWIFDATNEYYEANLIASGDQPSTDATVEMWIYPQTDVSSGDRGTLLRLNGNQSLYHSWNKNNRKLSNYWYSHNTVGSAGYHETGAAMALNQWHHTAAVWNYNDQKIYQYTNMTKTSGTTQGNATAGTNPEIGMESTGRQFAGGIAVCRIYNVALTDDEITQNYNAFKDRFGL